MTIEETMTLEGMAEEAGLSLSGLRNARDKNNRIFPRAVSGHGCKTCVYSRADFLRWLAQRDGKQGGLDAQLVSQFLRKPRENQGLYSNTPGEKQC
jgi:hypothetical protein